MQTSVRSFPDSIARYFSKDYYIRLAPGHLASLDWRHLYSAPDPAVAADAVALAGWPTSPTAAGSTEWTAHSADGPVSLAWDWVCPADGHLRALRLVTPRSNLWVLDRCGYDLPAGSVAQALWELIDQLPWQLQVATALADPETQH